MEEFRDLLISTILHNKLKNFDLLQNEGIKKRKMCIYFDGNYCKISFEEKIVSTWTSIDNKIRPHPILCYICPYFSVGEDDKITKSSLIDIYLYYIKMRERLEREIQYIESKINNLLYVYPSLKRRREELISLLDDINDKIKITLELIKLSEQIKV